MGIKNSSLTRVKPLFDKIGKAPDAIEELLSMMSGYRGLIVDYSDIEIIYGEKEKHLPPPKSLLLWQIENKEKLTIPKNYGVEPSSPSFPKRKAFFNGNEDLILEAKKSLIDGQNASGKWYAFEGSTVPDIYIETPSHIFIGEAKRTELQLTTDTTWLEERDQMVRHIDAVLDNPKEVIAFFIFNKEGFEKRFASKIDRYRDADYLKSSLPHRDLSEVERVAETFVGYAFWEDIAERFGIKFPDTIYD